MRRASLVLALVGLSAAPAAADPAVGFRARLRLGGFLGVRAFDDDGGLGRGEGAPAATALSTTMTFGGRAAWVWKEHLWLEGELALLPTSSADGSADVFVIGYRAHLLARLLPGEKVRPLGLIGFGGEAGLSSDTARVDDSAIAALHAGVGAETIVADRVALRVEVRAFLGPDLGGAPAATDVEVVLGATLLPPAGRARARPRPGDDDVHVDVDDLGVDGDRDGDRVPDRLDACPLEAEDRDGHDDEDGCPEREEDVDGDGDGVLGSLDLCPREAETPNQFQDDDGCPDDLPAGVVELRALSARITFGNGSTRLGRAARPIVDEIARLLAAHPALRLTIVGHTDPRGDRQANLALSLARAEAVRAYLVGKGIAAARLAAVGLGPDEPLADNATRAGRAENRRIELRVEPGGAPGR